MIEHNFEEVAKKFGEELKDAVAKTEATADALILNAYEELVTRSPIDEGRFRASHLMTFNSETNAEAPDGLEKTAYAAMGAKNLTSAQMKINSVETRKLKSIVIQNNLEYGQYLENGTSDQAPHGVYKIVWKIMKGAL